MKIQNSKIKNQKLTQTGFTLIEILVVTVILGLMVAVASNVFVTLLRNQNKTTILAEVRQNAALVIDTFERDVRSASKIETMCETDCTFPSTDPDTFFETLGGYEKGVLAAQVTSNKGLKLTYRDGGKVFWQCVQEPYYGSPATANGKFVRGVSGGAGVNLTNIDLDNGVSVVGCDFISDKPTDSNSARLVTLDMTLREGAKANQRFGDSVELSVSETRFKTTVGIRATEN